MLETDNYEKFKKDILQLAGIDLNLSLIHI